MKQTIKTIVLFLLEAQPATRDSDAKLYKEVAKNYFTETPYYCYDIEELLTKLSYQSVRDTRQTLQKKCNDRIMKHEIDGTPIDFIDIRGKNYNKRHRLGEEIRKSHSPTFWDKIGAMEDQQVR